MVLPYVAGVLLDDLAQPPSYDDETGTIPLDLVCAELAKRSIDPRERRVLSKFPEHYEKLIDLARFNGATPTVGVVATWFWLRGFNSSGVIF